MSNKINKPIYYSILFIAIAGCNWQNRNFHDIVNTPFANEKTYSQAPLKMPSSVVVCRTKQCAPAKLSMSKEYIYNSLLHLFQNNNHQKALICDADSSSHACLENFITMPIKVGITPAYAYIDSVKITDINVSRGNKINLILNYNITYNGQSPECRPSSSIMFVKNSDNIIMEDSGYSCKMTTIGTTSVKTLFAIDYIDLDYGYIGGYYSIGMSGPAFGGGSGYMMIRLPKDAHPLNPVLTIKSTAEKISKIQGLLNDENPTSNDGFNESTNTNVQVFPIKK